MFKDTKHRAASLRKLSFLFFCVRIVINECFPLSLSLTIWRWHDVWCDVYLWGRSAHLSGRRSCPRWTSPPSWRIWSACVELASWCAGRSSRVDESTESRCRSWARTRGSSSKGRWCRRGFRTTRSHRVGSESRQSTERSFNTHILTESTGGSREQSGHAPSGLSMWLSPLHRQRIFLLAADLTVNSTVLLKFITSPNRQ